LLCSSNPAAPSQYAAVPNPDQTRLFADAEGHLSTAGQKIVADYYYSLVVAPSQISFLPETAVKTRTRLVSNIQAQIEATRQQPPGPLALNAWVTGDVSHLGMDNYHGFPDDPGTPAALAAGLTARLPFGILLGAAVSTGHVKSDFSSGRGDFKQDEIAGSVYAAAVGGPLWGTLVATYGSLDYDVNRLAPIGITTQINAGKTDGSNVSVAAQAGFNMTSGPLTHGPVVGLTWQRVEVDAFTESGSFTSLAFAEQKRDSAIGSLGWRASLNFGLVRPFGQIVWNHELASTTRDVTASLTTIAAPSYSLPAVALGKDWGTATLGTNVILGPGVTGLAAVSADFGQSDVVTYGAQIGINIGF
jgi:outer membrane lipase/esterase